MSDNSTYTADRIPDADHFVGRPATKPTQSRIEYGIECIEWADRRVVEWHRAMAKHYTERNMPGRATWHEICANAIEQGNHRG